MPQLPDQGPVIVVVNAGSSSLKIARLDADDTQTHSWNLPAGSSLGTALRAAEPYDAVGHRVVHGGSRFTSATLIDDHLELALTETARLAPLHNPPALQALAAARRESDKPQVACFDTAFHATIDEAARTYAVPLRWREEFGIRRYGFHGLSHAWVARRGPQLLPDAHRIVSCHLGAGASLCAIADGISVDTTMGFTPLEGLVMNTRSGNIDPGAVLQFAQLSGTDPVEVERILNRESGLLGLSGLSGDIRDLLASELPAARLAIDVYVHRLRGLIASMAAGMGGTDALVFTGGVGEHQPVIRARVCAALGFLGIDLDEEANAGAVGVDAVVGDGVAVVHAREDLSIAAQTRDLLQSVRSGANRR